MIHTNIWLEQFLRKSAHQLMPGQLSPEALEEESRVFLSKHSRVFIDAKLDISCTEHIQCLENTGFRLADIQITFSGKAPKGEPEHNVRPVLIQDETQISDIAAKAFALSRFHCDPHIGPHIGTRIKQETVHNFFVGIRGDGMVIIEEKQSIIGFLLFFIRGDTFIIDHIAVIPSFQGKGVSQALIKGALSFQPAAQVEAVTQASNIAAQNLYLATSLRPSKYTCVLHCHA